MRLARENVDDLVCAALLTQREGEAATAVWQRHGIEPRDNLEAVVQPFLEEHLPDLRFVHAVFSRFVFDKQRLETLKPTIASVLEELPDNFHHSRGGTGATVLDMGMRRDGSLWEVDTVTVDGLIALILGTGLGKFCGNRDLWPIFPGGVPFLLIGGEPRKLPAAIEAEIRKFIAAGMDA